MYIVFEGVDASGKSTQAHLLANAFKAKGIETVITKEPGSPHDRFCEKIRKLVLDPDIVVHENAALLLFLADRAQHIEQVIKPALEAGKIVISDRSAVSSLIYYCASREEGWLDTEEAEFVINMQKFAQQIKPDICFITRSANNFSKSVLNDRNTDRIENKGEEFHNRIKLLFDYIIEKEVSTAWWPSKVVGLPEVPKHTVPEVFRFVLKELNEVIEHKLE